MDTRVLAFVALAVTVLYGGGFIVIPDQPVYAVLGAALVAILWLLVLLAHRRDRRRSS